MTTLTACPLCSGTLEPEHLGGRDVAYCASCDLVLDPDLQPMLDDPTYPPFRKDVDG